MAEGTVKWFNPRKGYGFIADKEGRDIFVHYASISGEGYKTLNEGEPVSFDIVEGEKGLRAENVIPKAAASGKETKATSKSKATSESSEATSESSKATSESSKTTSESSKTTSESSETAEDEDKATS
jgi:CspA family cold shock protein